MKLKLARSPLAIELNRILPEYFGLDGGIPCACLPGLKKDTQKENHLRFLKRVIG